MANNSVVNRHIHSTCNSKHAERRSRNKTCNFLKCKSICLKTACVNWKLLHHGFKAFCERYVQTRYLPNHRKILFTVHMESVYYGLRFVDGKNNCTILYKASFMARHYNNTCLLLLISMLWHRQAIFKSKGDKLCSSAECRIWTQGPRHQIASKLNARWQPIPMISEHSAHLTPLSVDFHTWLWRYTCLYKPGG